MLNIRQTLRAHSYFVTVLDKLTSHTIKLGIYGVRYLLLDGEWTLHAVEKTLRIYPPSDHCVNRVLAYYWTA